MSTGTAPEPKPFKPKALKRQVHYMQLKIDEAACTNCGACVEICPVEAISLGKEFAKVAQDECAACGACLPGCPENALDIVET